MHASECGLLEPALGQRRAAEEDLVLRRQAGSSVDEHAQRELVRRGQLARYVAVPLFQVDPAEDRVSRASNDSIPPQARKRDLSLRVGVALREGVTLAREADVDVESGG